MAAAGARAAKNSELVSTQTVSEHSWLVQKNWNTYHDNILRIHLENKQIATAVRDL